MKRWISSLALASVTAACVAQSFTIVRPPDGSKVREKVHILIPNHSIPPDGYIGVFLDGKLLEAVVPPVHGKFYDYVLDTKGRGLPDSEPGKPSKLEVVLYTDFNDQSRIVDRSSVNVYIANKANISVPNAGIKLRYKFVPDTELIYDLDQHVLTTQQSEEQQKAGAKASISDTEGEKFRIMYAVDDAYPGGDGLLQIQPLPTAGKNYADITPMGSTTPDRWSLDELTAVYMRVSDTGREVFGSLPPYLPLEGSSAASTSSRHLYGAFPLPSLPYKNVRIGDAWQTSFQLEDINLSFDLTSVVKQVPARGEFEDVEWEQGHPCAKIHNTIEAANLDKIYEKDLQQQATAADANAPGDASGADKTEPSKFSLSEDVWFALDTHQVVKIVRDVTLDLKSQIFNNGQGGAPGVGGPGGGFPGGGFPGRPGGGFPGGPGGPGGVPGGIPGGGFGGGKGDKSILPGGTNYQFGGMRGGKGGMMGGPGAGGGFPGAGGGFPGGGFGRQGAGGAMSNVFTQLHIVETYTLVKVQKS